MFQCWAQSSVINACNSTWVTLAGWALSLRVCWGPCWNVTVQVRSGAAVELLPLPKTRIIVFFISCLWCECAPWVLVRIISSAVAEAHPWAPAGLGQGHNWEDTAKAIVCKRFSPQLRSSLTLCWFW